VLSGEAINTNFTVFRLTRPESLNPGSTAIEANMLTITPPMRLCDKINLHSIGSQIFYQLFFCSIMTTILTI